MNKFMNLALKEAYEGIEYGDGGPFGCVIVKDNKVVGKGHNMVVATCDCTAHGEIEAIRDACNGLRTFDLSGCELYTTSEPCPMCKGAIQWARIAKVYYGCTIADAEDIGFSDRIFFENDIDSTQIDQDECKILFQKYKENDHTLY